MSPNLPLVSVVIPAFRAGATLVRAVESLRAQTLTDWEALVVADDQTDYRALLEAAGIRDPRLRFAGTGGIGLGAARARNVGLEAARGRTVAWLDADDRYAPQRLARLVPVALSCGAAADNVLMVRSRDDSRLGLLFESVPSTLTPAVFLRAAGPLFLVCHHDSAGRWDEGLHYAEEVLYNLRVLDRLGAIPLEPEPLYEHRVHDLAPANAGESAAAAERAYSQMLGWLETDTLTLTTKGLHQRFRQTLKSRRAASRRFAEACRDGRCRNYPEFLALAG